MRKIVSDFNVTVFEGCEFHSKKKTGFYGLKVSDEIKTLPQYKVLMPYKGIRVWLGIKITGKAVFLVVNSIDDVPIGIDEFDFDSKEAESYYGTNAM